MIKLYRRLVKALTKKEKTIPLKLMCPYFVGYNNNRTVIISCGVSIFDHTIHLREGDEVFGFALGDLEPRRFMLERDNGSRDRWFFSDVLSPNRYRIEDFSWIEK